MINIVEISLAMWYSILFISLGLSYSQVWTENWWESLIYFFFCLDCFYIGVLQLQYWLYILSMQYFLKIQKYLTLIILKSVYDLTKAKRITWKILSFVSYIHFVGRVICSYLIILVIHHYSASILNFFFVSHVWTIYYIKWFFWMMIFTFNAVFKWRFLIEPYSLLCIFMSINFPINYYMLYFIWKPSTTYTSRLLDQIGTELEPVYFFWPCLIFFSFAALLFIQHKYGSRFFLPMRYKERLFEYQRHIGRDFPLQKLRKSEWPTCNLCLEFLHKPSAIFHSQELYSRNDRESCLVKTFKGIYCRTPSGEAFHPQCFISFVLPWNRRQGDLLVPDIDDFDD